MESFKEYLEKDLKRIAAIYGDGYRYCHIKGFTVNLTSLLANQKAVKSDVKGYYVLMTKI